MRRITFATIRRRNQLTSFLVFLVLVVLMFLSMRLNPWYRIPIEWYFIPVLGLVGSILLPAFFGRHYCGQYCPTGFIADSMNTTNRAGSFLKSRSLRKFFVSLLLGIFVLALVPWNMGLPASMTVTYWHAVMNKLWILWILCPFAIALPTVVALGLTKGGRTWCNYLCPWGAIGVAFGSEQLVVTDGCTDCQACVQVCPQPEVLVGAVGNGGTVDKNCLLCLRCVDACPTEGTIRLK
ncbi:MAG TPA: 4Fe-4S binding protein [Symbiobacteriaceae bacterium]|jgi:ferredoxin-type protein NapH